MCVLVDQNMQHILSIIRAQIHELLSEKHSGFFKCNYNFINGFEISYKKPFNQVTCEPFPTKGICISMFQ